VPCVGSPIIIASPCDLTAAAKVSPLPEVFQSVRKTTLPLILLALDGGINCLYEVPCIRVGLVQNGTIVWAVLYGKEEYKLINNSEIIASPLISSIQCL